MTTTFHSHNPATGSTNPGLFRAAPPDEVDTACLLAEEAFRWMIGRRNTDRAALLDAMAANILALGEELLTTAGAETGLAVPRLQGERDRTVFTLRALGQLVREGRWVRAEIDRADPARKPLPKPDLRRMLRPLGPVAVFGASNFPLAYSTAGGDTASALAAGCPVVVKGHPSHPATSQMVAEAVISAVRDTNFHHGTFQHLPAGGDRELAIGQELVTHPAIKAVGFTGSFRGGTALARLAASRPEPIPVFAEMGSINPIFILPGALAAEAESIAEKIIGAVTNSNGQMCTCPGLVFIVRGDGANLFLDTLAARAAASPAQPMLSARVRAGFLERLHEVSQVPGVEQAARGQPAEGSGTSQPVVVLRASLSALLRFPTLREECFGPSTIVVECDEELDLLKGADAVPGSLVGAIFAAHTDRAGALAQILAGKVGRLVFNGVTTGVEVSAAMVHGGPWPATNQQQSTAVGAMAVERWCRPVCWQNAPPELFPEELRG